jgi:L-asparaginase II
VSVPLVATTRNGVVERLERGHCVVSDANGCVLWSIGDRDHVTYLRSSAKPIQATALVMSGAMDRFNLTDANLSVACGSHRGEPRHVSTALDTLRRAGVPPEALGCGIHELYHMEGVRLAAAGLAPTPLHNNCSGKHAGMLASSVALGSPVETYLSPDHPLQKMILAALSACAGLPPDQIHPGIDGCSAPNFAMPIHGIARCFATVAARSSVSAELSDALRRVSTAMQRDPWLVAGTGEFDTTLMSALPGRVVAKAGAEALQCLALPRLGLGIAVKIESGQGSTLPSVVMAILGAIGILPDALPPELARFKSPPIRNHLRIHVGETRLHIQEDLEALAALRLARS